MNIGLVGFNTAQGLGYVNRDIANCLGIKRWIVTKHDRFPMLPLIETVESIIVKTDRIVRPTLSSCLKGLDVVLFVETVKTVESLPLLAKKLGIKTVCVPMVEGLRLKQSWTQSVDLWLAPTAFSYCQLQTLNVPGKVVYCPWPIDTRNFEYKQRHVCERFVYAHGNGGRNDRKGGNLIAAAVKIAPEIPITVYSQVQDGYMSLANREVKWPSTIDFRGSAHMPSDIYQDGDVFIMPSRFEGLGLQLFECQAAGMPLICTDGPPMNESNPWKRLPCTPSRVDIAYRCTSWDSSPENIAQVMRKTIGCNISQASQDARNWVVANRDWITLAPYIRSLL